MLFKDRKQAAELLAQALEKYKGKNPLILGIPRGAMPMAQIIADKIQGELSAILVHKISSPINSEFAIGSVGYSGKIHKNPTIELMQISEKYVRSEATKQLRMLKQRYKKYGITPQSYKDRIVIIVDDGIATGATVKAAIAEVQSQHPTKIVVAAAVAAKDTAENLRSLVDELVLLKEDNLFFSVSQFFESFPQVTDAEAIKILNRKSLESGAQPSTAVDAEL